jgi:hypothetical protein
VRADDLAAHDGKSGRDGAVTSVAVICDGDRQSRCGGNAIGNVDLSPGEGFGGDLAMIDLRRITIYGL